MDVFTLAAKLTLETGEFSAELAQAESEAKGFGSSKVWKTIGKAAAGAVVVAGAGVAKAIKSSVETGMQFDAMMSEVQAVSGATGHEFDILRARAQELGATTKFTATEAAEAFYYMGLAGWDAEEMLDGIGPVLSLAAASGEDLGRTSDILTDTLTALGYEAKDAARFSDVLAATVTKSNTTMAMAGETFKYLATTGGVLGYDMEDVALAIGLLANNGIKAGQAGTTLRQIINTLINPSEDAAAAMNKLGVSLFEEGTNKRKPLYQVINELREIFKDANFDLEGFDPEVIQQDIIKLNEWYDAQVQEISDANMGKAKTLQAMKELNAEYEEEFTRISEPNKWFLGKLGDIGGLRGISSLFALMMSSDEDVKQLYTAIQDSEGKAQEMAETMLDNLKGDITILNSAIDGLKLVVSDEFKEPFRKFVQEITKGISDITQSIRENGLAKGIWSVLFGDGSVEDQMYDAQLTADQTIYSVDQTQAKADALIERLGEMAGNTEKTAVQMGVFKGLAEELISLVPSLAGQIDIENGSLKTSTEQLKENTAAWAENAKQQALSKALAEQQEAMAKAAQAAVDAEIKAGVADAKNVANLEKAVNLANEILKTDWIAGVYGSNQVQNTDNVEKLLKDLELISNYAFKDNGTSGAAMELGMAVSEAQALQKESEDARAKADELNQQLEQAKADYELYAQSIEAMMGTAGQSAVTATGNVDDLNTAINSLPDSKTVRINVITDQPNFIPHAKGAASIPYDNYPALLHRGEMVLTASQARRYRDGQGGFSLASITSAVAEAVRAGLEQAKFDFELDGDVLTRGVIRRQTNDAMARRFATV